MQDAKLPHNILIVNNGHAFKCKQLTNFEDLTEF